MHILRDAVGDCLLRNPYGDADLLVRHEALGEDPSRVIYLSLGETWSEAAPGLRAALAEAVPGHGHGYVLTPYGLPSLHRELRSYITTTHRLDLAAALGEDYEVAVSQNSTRSAMFDFGRLLREEEGPGGGRPVAVCSSPGWDYPGVFTALGYEMRYFTVAPERQYQPVAEEVELLLRQARKSTAGPVLLVLNPQHNPTGANWDPVAVRRMIRAALSVDACVLLDDAYFAVHDPDIVPTCALQILLEELRAVPPGRRPRWLAVRSLGKQFHCNGWGIGALTASPDTVESLRSRMLPQYSYVSSVPLQAAMAAWLQDDASTAYLEWQRTEYAAKRGEVAERLVKDLGYPDDAFFPGRCATYLLLRVPPWFEGHPAADEGFRWHCLRQASVLLGEAHMTTPGKPANASQGYARFFLGPRRELLTEALDRMAAAGLGWNASPASTRPGRQQTVPQDPTPLPPVPPISVDRTPR